MGWPISCFTFLVQPAQSTGRRRNRHFRFQFAGEPGLDAGGVAREWFELSSKAPRVVDYWDCPLDRAQLFGRWHPAVWNEESGDGALLSVDEKALFNVDNGLFEYSVRAMDAWTD